MSSALSSFFRSHAEARVARACVQGALLSTLLSGCIDSLVVDMQYFTASDAEIEIGDGAAAQPEPEPEPTDAALADAGSAAPPVMDAGEPAPHSDAGHDAGLDAGSQPPARDAGERPDASCADGRCDAGATPQSGPCATCGGIMVLVQPAGSDPVCDNRAPTVCWTNPGADCTMQCPDTGSCTKDDPGVCGPDRYCYFPRNDCGASSAGFCASLPKECSTVNAPVCGCDGVIHQNTCVAASLRTAVYTGLPTDHCK
jgi:hypothetical protein